MRSDNDVQRNVVDELRWNPSVKDEEIAVAVKDGVVTIGGFVDTYAQKHAAERAVQRVAGVKAVADEVQVKVTGRFQRTDTEIAHAVEGEESRA